MRKKRDARRALQMLVSNDRQLAVSGGKKAMYDDTAAAVQILLLECSHMYHA